MERIVILPIIGFFTLGIVFFLLVIWGPSLYKKRKSRHAPVVSLSAQVAKVYYDAYGSPPAVSFRVDGEKRPRKFDSRIPEITQFPEPGTRGTLTCKGYILYSFRWDGGEVIQDAPGSDGEQTYSNL